MVQVSFFAAFIAGGLSVLPACGPALLPAFFAYSFTQPRRLVLATVLFAGSFGLVFIPFGLGVAWLANFLVTGHVVLTRAVGGVLLIFAFGSLAGWTMPRRVSTRMVTPTAGLWRVVVLGLTFGFTASSCIAPVLGAIITTSIGAEDPVNALVLLLWFLAGMFTPLLIISLCLQRFGRGSMKKLFQWGLEIHIGQWSHRVYWGQFVAFGLFGGLGLLYIFGSPAAWLGGWSAEWLQDRFFEINTYLLGY